MKNIHLIPTDSPSRLFDDGMELYLGELKDRKGHPVTSYNIYITSDEEIEDDDYLIVIDDFETYIHKHKGDNLPTTFYKKIILTTDEDLIEDGVQAIDDEFLNWFVKNPSFEEVEVLEDYFKPSNMVYGHDTEPYKIIIPKEEQVKKK